MIEFLKAKKIKADLQGKKFSNAAIPPLVAQCHHTFGVLTTSSGAGRSWDILQHLKGQSEKIEELVRELKFI